MTFHVRNIPWLRKLQASFSIHRAFSHPQHSMAAEIDVQDAQGLISPELSPAEPPEIQDKLITTLADLPGEEFLSFQIPL